MAAVFPKEYWERIIHSYAPLTRGAILIADTRVLVSFLIRAVVVGLAVAFLVVWWKPALLGAKARSRPRRMPPPAAAPLRGPPTVVMQSFADSVARAAPAVVNIYTARVVTERTQSPSLNQLFGDYWPSYRQRVERSLGSGVIVDAMGTIVTNQHVIAGADSIRVQLADGRIADAAIVGQDPDTDLAILDLTIGQAARHADGPFGYLAGRRYRARDRQSLRPESDRHPGHRQRHRAAVNWASRPSRISSRPMPPSISATPAARSSTRTAIWSASTPPC